MRKTNAAGIDLIQEFESLQLKAYKCPAGIWTIGYGHTGPDVKEGMVITQEKAEEILKADLSRFEKSVESLVTVSINDNQFSALVSFAFNVGAGNLKSSTLLRKLNAGEYAADEFLKWNKAGGKVLSGLTRRRKAERELFLKEV